MSGIPAGTIIDERFRILELAGAGGMGTVYKCQHLSLEKIIALKVIENSALSPTVLKRAKREAAILCSVDHPSLVRMHAVGTLTDGRFFLAMDFVDLPSMRSILRRDGKFTPQQLLPVARDVCAGLASLHSKGIIHCDLKPENILVSSSSDSPSRIIDFGIAKSLQQTGKITQTGEVCGTPTYISPQRWRGVTATPEDDVYALSCILFEALSGHPPFVGSTAFEAALLHAESPVPSLAGKVEPAIEMALDNFFKIALSKNPADRYTSHDEYTTAFANACQGKITVEHVAKAQPKKRKVLAVATPLLSALCTLGLVIVCASFAVTMSNSHNAPKEFSSGVVMEAITDARHLRNDGKTEVSASLLEEIISHCGKDVDPATKIQLRMELADMYLEEPLLNTEKAYAHIKAGLALAELSSRRDLDKLLREELIRANVIDLRFADGLANANELNRKDGLKGRTKLLGLQCLAMSGHHLEATPSLELATDAYTHARLHGDSKGSMSRTTLAYCYAQNGRSAEAVPLLDALLKEDTKLTALERARKTSLLARYKASSGDKDGTLKMLPALKTQIDPLLKADTALTESILYAADKPALAATLANTACSLFKLCISEATTMSMRHQAQFKYVDALKWKAQLASAQNKPESAKDSEAQLKKCITDLVAEGCIDKSIADAVTQNRAQRAVKS